MSREQAVKLWRKGAEEALRVAQILLQEKSYSLCLFHCHLAVEKALKAQYILEKDMSPPFTHSLTLLAEHLQHQWADQDITTLRELTECGVHARYDDIDPEEATDANARRWIASTRRILSQL